MFTIKLSQQQLELIFVALGEMPLKISGPVFTSLQQQIDTPSMDKWESACRTVLTEDEFARVYTVVMGEN